MLYPLCWNRTTGNLVSGHQRLDILDQLHGSLNYSLTTSVVELDIKTEKEQNIFMNNPSAQGEYDLDLLNAMSKTIDWSNTGMDAADLSAIGVNYDLTPKPPQDFEAEMLADLSALTPQEDAADHAERKKNIQNVKKAAKEKAHDIDPGLTYIVVTFSSRAEKNRFLKKINFEDDDKYVKGEILHQLLP